MPVRPLQIVFGPMRIFFGDPVQRTPQTLAPTILATGPKVDASLQSSRSGKPLGLLWQCGL